MDLLLCWFLTHYIVYDPHLICLKGRRWLCHICQQLIDLMLLGILQYFPQTIITFVIPQSTYSVESQLLTAWSSKWNERILLIEKKPGWWDWELGGGGIEVFLGIGVVLRSRSMLLSKFDLSWLCTNYLVSVYPWLKGMGHGSDRENKTGTAGCVWILISCMLILKQQKQLDVLHRSQ